MQELIERIRRDGVHLGGGIVKVDSFLNHQVDPALTERMAQELHCRFKWENNSIAFWDNRCTAHKGIFDFGQAHRLMHRVAVQGETVPSK